MASNFKQRGDTVTLTAPYDVASGAGVQVGKIFGVAANDALTGETLEVHRAGVFEVNKLSTDQAAEGTPFYWDDGNKRLTITASTHLLVGNNLAAVGNPSATVEVVLTPIGN